MVITHADHRSTRFQLKLRLSTAQTLSPLVQSAALLPEFQIDSHTGYTIKETDIHDVTLLSKKFGLPLHPEQLEYLAEHPRN